MRYFGMLLLTAALASCAAAQPPSSAAAPTVRAQPSERAPSAEPAATLRSEATAPPTLGTEATAPAPATGAPLAQATLPASAQLAPLDPAAPLDQPFDTAAQSRALLPQFERDLDQTGAWNRYTIAANLDARARTLGGRQRLEYTNRDSAALGEIYFHLYPNLRDFGGKLTVSNVAVDGQAAAAETPRADLLRVRLAEPLQPGAALTITLDFAARAPENASRTRYGAFNKENGVLALASAYPLVAVVRGGVWDTGPLNGIGDFVNAETSLYDVSLSGPPDWRLVTTGVAVAYQADRSRQQVRFVSGPQREFTIAAVQLEQASADVDGTRVTSYFRSGSGAGGRTALQAAVQALQVFNQRYGRYPLAELDVIEIDARQFLGVEYPGLVMIEHALYARPQDLEITIAHEVAHQWWYSLVGNDVQRASWLDEALASYSQVVYQEEIRGSAAAERELDGFRQRYRQNLAAGRDAPVEQPNSSFRGNYVALVYGKAVLFYQALRITLGDQQFSRFLHEYYAQHRYGYVRGEDVVQTANGVCGCDIRPLYTDWITKSVPLKTP
jgi:aminopeptidase N